MNPTNFSRQALGCMNEGTLKTWAQDIESCEIEVLRISLESSIKFALPNNADIIDDYEFKALSGMDIHLPYPIVSLEFFWRRKTDRDGKYIILADEATANAIGISVLWGSGGRWIFYPRFTIIKDVFRRGGSRFSKETGLWSADSCDIDGPAIWRECQNVMGLSLTSLFSFLNALTCRNVHIEKLGTGPPKKAKCGALPFDEYHVLTISNTNTSPRDQSAGTHRSPREHLRRGHVRQLANGERIWINATVVNSNIGGRVRKSYRCKSF